MLLAGVAGVLGIAVAAGAFLWVKSVRKKRLAAKTRKALEAKRLSMRRKSVSVLESSDAFDLAPLEDELNVEREADPLAECEGADYI
jgi:hypothetical protein